MKYSEFFKFLEKKDHIIKKLDSLTNEQKQTAIDFFTKHPSYENEIDWNRQDISWEDIEEVIYKERISGTQLKSFIKKDKHFLVLYSDANCALYQPLTWLGSRYLASTDVKPKVEGKWCISYQKDRQHWDSYSLNKKRSFIILCTLTNKYALEIHPEGTFTPWDVKDNRLTLFDFYDEISKEVLDIDNILQKYISVAVINRSLVEKLHERDLEECAYIEKVKKEEREHRIKIFPKSFKRQIRRKGYYQWDGDISYSDLVDLNLVDEKGRVDERFKYFKISGSLDFELSRITSITTPSSATSINDKAFYFCNELLSIIIPDSIKSIGEMAFAGCRKLKSINIPDSVTSIGMNAFWNCISLTEIAIPNSVTSIDDYAFYNCKSLTEIEISDSVKSIGDYAFCECKSLTEIIIPKGVAKIGVGTFSDCRLLEKVIISDSVKEINYRAFYDCSSLRSVTIGNSIEFIGYQAFSRCTSLKNIYIDKEKDSLDLSEAGISKDCKIYWRGEF